MLEQEGSLRKCATLEDETCIREPIERVLQFCPAPLRDDCQQLVGEVLADGGADLCDFFRRWA